MPATHSTLWDEILETVESRQPDLNRGWFPALQISGINHGTLTIRAANVAQYQYLESRCVDAFSEAAQEKTGRLLSVAFEIVPSESNPISQPFAFPEPNPAFTLDRFATGPCNRFAHAAISAFTQKENASYRSIYLHGPAGTGKTHLLHAAANVIRAASPTANVPCLQADFFASTFIRSMERDELSVFRSTIDDLEFLLLDDIEKLANRPLAQEEIFRAFNAAHSAGRPILITGHAAPTELTGLEERLRTRLSSCFVVAIDPPCHETRVLILRNLALRNGFELENDAATILAESSDLSAPELEHLLACADRWSNACGGLITAKLARSISSRPSIIDLPTANNILHGVAREYRLSADSIRETESKSKNKEPRAVAIYLTARLTDANSTEISRLFGSRTDAFIRRTIESTEERLRTDLSFRNKVTDLVADLATISQSKAQPTV
ncbi:MAG: DnaA/Hda family protein [Planctomycetota bacterium]